MKDGGDDERVIYQDGFDSTNAETFATIDAQGNHGPRPRLQIRAVPLGSAFTTT